MRSLLGFIAASCVAANGYDFQLVDRVLENAVSSRISPSFVGAIGTKDGGVLYSKAFGSFVYEGQNAPRTPGQNPAVTTATRYDLASLSKVTATTSAIATLYQEGFITLDTKVSTILGASFDAHGKKDIRILNLLLHNAGFPPDPVPGYWNSTFGCPATSDEHPPLTFSCDTIILDELRCNQTLQYPIGSEYVYSDLSMITAMFVAGRVVVDNALVTPSDLLPSCAGAESGEGELLVCHFEAFVRTKVFGPLGMESTGYAPNGTLTDAERAAIPPTWVDPIYRHETAQGVVSDENSYALGGVSGHAGVFSTVGDLAKLALAYLNAPASGGPFLNQTTVALFTAQYNASQSSRALGWDTNAPQNDYKGCDMLSSKTFTHLGYTGTEICIDPMNEMFTVILDNRCYPDKTGQMETIRTARRSFNDAALKAVLAARGQH